MNYDDIEATKLSKPADSNAADASKSMVKEAQTLYRCKDGSHVSNPRQCTETLDSLPKLSLG